VNQLDCHRRSHHFERNLTPAWARQDHTSLFPYSDEHR
jgi:hypothetical protein